LQGLIQLLNLWIWTCDILFVYNFPTLGCKSTVQHTHKLNLKLSWAWTWLWQVNISEILNKPKNLGNLGRSVIWKDSCSSCW
jgi:hypothetical protein